MSDGSAAEGPETDGSAAGRPIPGEAAPDPADGPSRADGPGGAGLRTPASLLRSSAVVSVGTGLSRLTGLLRTLALIWALEFTTVADAYNLANTAPNVIYDLILGGVLAATLVPVLVDRFDRDDRDAISAVGTVITVLLVVLTAVAVLAAPAIVRLYTWTLDPVEQAAQESVAVPLMRLFLPQVLFYGLTALGTALLNARRRFALAAFAPVLNNVFVICILLAVPRMAGGVPTVDQVTSDTGLLLLLGLGTTAGIAAMALVLLPGLVSADVPMRWNPDWRNPAVHRILRLSGWTLGYVATNQVGLVVLLALANGTGEGAVSSWSYAYLFFQLPYGLFAVAVMTTFLPELSGAFSRQDLTAYRDRFVLGLRLILLVVLPSAVLLVGVAEPLVGLLFEVLGIGDASPSVTAGALAAFAAGLPGFSVYLYVMRGWYARQDTRTPFLVNLAETAFTLVLAIPLTAAFDLTGTVAAFSLGYTVFSLLALAGLRRRLGGLASGGALAGVLRAVAAAAAMGLVLGAVALGVDADDAGGQAVRVVLAVVLGGGAYLGVLAATGSHDLRLVADRVRGRRAG